VREERRTLTRYTIASEHLHPSSTGDFSGLLNAVAAATRRRSRRDGSEISRQTATYLVTDGPIGRRISALAIHSP
jgi:hypothetical protein